MYEDKIVYKDNRYVIYHINDNYVAQMPDGGTYIADYIGDRSFNYADGSPIYWYENIYGVVLPAEDNEEDLTNDLFFRVDESGQIIILNDDYNFMNNVIFDSWTFNLYSKPINIFNNVLAGDKFSEDVKFIQSYFNEGRAIYSQYVNVSVKIHGKWETLVDTTSNNLTENMFVSLRHKLNGSGSANEFTLEILFSQNDRTIQDIITVEKKLLDTCDVIENNGVKKLEDIYFNCKFQYGYNERMQYDGQTREIKSPIYTAAINTFNCDMENGYLKYTIHGISSIYCNKEVRLSTKDEYKPNEVKSPLEYIENIFKVEFNTEGSENYGLFDVKFLNNCYNDYTGEFLGTNTSSYTQFTQKNLFEILDDILAGTVILNDGEDESNISPNTLQTFSYYIDDTLKNDNTKSIGTVIIYKTPAAGDSLNSSGYLTDITFNWFGVGINNNDSTTQINNLVKSWKPKFDGSAMRALATTIKTSGTSFPTIDDLGNIVNITSLGATRLGIKDINNARFDVAQEYNKWAHATQYQYEAEMVTLGIPSEVALTTRINIKAIISSTTGIGTLHHSSGTYMIIGKEDVISSTGFFSNFKLFKIDTTTPNLMKLLNSNT